MTLIRLLPRPHSCPRPTRQLGHHRPSNCRASSHPHRPAQVSRRLNLHSRSNSSRHHRSHLHRSLPRPKAKPHHSRLLRLGLLLNHRDLQLQLSNSHSHSLVVSLRQANLLPSRLAMITGCSSLRKDRVMSFHHPLSGQTTWASTVTGATPLVGRASMVCLHTARSRETSPRVGTAAATGPWAQARSRPCTTTDNNHHTPLMALVLSETGFHRKDTAKGCRHLQRPATPDWALLHPGAVSSSVQEEVAS